MSIPKTKGQGNYRLLKETHARREGLEIFSQCFTSLNIQEKQILVLFLFVAIDPEIFLHW